MKAIEINKYGCPEELSVKMSEIPICKENELLIKVFASSINPVDWKIQTGQLRLFSGWKFPRKLGSDFAGEVVAQGKKVNNFKIGDHVFGFVDPRRGGAYAEYITVSSELVAPKPKNLSFEEAAVCPLAGLTALQALKSLVNNQRQQRILVNGASGGVGSFAIQIAKAMSWQVIGVCSTNNLEFVKKLGADEVIDYTQINWIEIDNKHDLVFDVVGTSNFRECQKLLKKPGNYITTLPTIKNLWYILTTVFKRQKAQLIIVSPKSSDLQLLKQLIETQKIQPVINRIYPLSQLKSAFQLSQTGRVTGKIALSIPD